MFQTWRDAAPFLLSMLVIGAAGWLGLFAVYALVAEIFASAGALMRGRP